MLKMFFITAMFLWVNITHEKLGLIINKNRGAYIYIVSTEKKKKKELYGHPIEMICKIYTK